MGPARARRPLDRLRPAPRRHEGDPQRQDQDAARSSARSPRRCWTERVGEWFEEDDDVPFMMQVFQIREEKRPLIPGGRPTSTAPAVCRPCTRAANPRYHALIAAFSDITGVPMVLNTSFNENEPVVCKPEEALDCFLRTRMDALVLGEFVLRRRSAAGGGG